MDEALPGQQVSGQFILIGGQIGVGGLIRPLCSQRCIGVPGSIVRQ
jgi:hypothetical protein